MVPFTRQIDREPRSISLKQDVPFYALYPHAYPFISRSHTETISRNIKSDLWELLLLLTCAFRAPLHAWWLDILEEKADEDKTEILDTPRKQNWFVTVYAFSEKGSFYNALIWISSEIIQPIATIAFFVKLQFHGHHYHNEYLWVLQQSLWARCRPTKTHKAPKHLKPDITIPKIRKNT